MELLVFALLCAVGLPILYVIFYVVIAVYVIACEALWSFYGFLFKGLRAVTHRAMRVLRALATSVCRIATGSTES